MACNGANQPGLSGLADPTPQTNNKDAPKKRRFRFCRSAPVADVNAPATNGKESIPSSETIFGKPRPNYKKIAAYLIVHLGMGTMGFYSVRNQIEGKKTNEILDSIYFCIVTVTTVGYGDLVPNSVLSKLLACAFVFSGMALGGVILSKVVNYSAEKQEILLVQALHMHQKTGRTNILKQIETKKLKYRLIITLVLMFVHMIGGTVFLFSVEKMEFIDAFYCVCTTITTLGYGDKSFSSTGGRVFAVFWISTSTLSIARLYLYVVEISTVNRQRALVEWLLTRRMTKGDLEAADIDEDGVVSASEFVLYKLKEMGKIKQEDVTLAMKEFEDLHVDQSGTMSRSDLTLAHDPQTKS